MPYRLVLSALAFAAAVASAQTPPPGFTTKDVTMAPDTPATNAAPSSNDPRVCLEFEDRMQIIACANKYLPRKRVAKG
jgi:hypothetical protein